MKKVLVLAANYPNNDGGVALMYVHVRNKYYVQHGLNVKVLNFSVEQGYEKDGIKVFSLEEYNNSQEEYDVLILHAPNIRNHYRFLRRNESKFKHILIFFHGHEVLKLNKTYPKPYDYMKTSSWARMKFQDCYDLFKLTIWRYYLPKIAEKTDFIFVSNNFFEEFQYYTKLDSKKLKNHVHIINNSVGEIFEEKKYDQKVEKQYDFITIRNMLDESVYCIDLLCKVAELNPEKTFLLIGRGHFFEHNIKPENIKWVDRFLNHDEMLNYLDRAKCALMMTRRDTQGVMSCELVTYGIPLITSDLPICHEIFDGIDGIRFVDNNCLSKISILQSCFCPATKTDKYIADNTISKEVNIICQ